MMHPSFTKIMHAAERETGLHRAVDLLQQDTTDFDRLGGGDVEDGAGGGGDRGGGGNRVKFVVPEEPGIVSLRTAIRHVERPDPALPIANNSSSSGGGSGRGATAPAMDLLDAVRARAAQRIDPLALAQVHCMTDHALAGSHPHPRTHNHHHTHQGPSTHAPGLQQ